MEKEWKFPKENFYKPADRSKCPWKFGDVWPIRNYATGVQNDWNHGICPRL